MAVHNGADYLLPQLRSILALLKSTDEVVVVDDASQDNSVELLRSLFDPRVKLYFNNRNLGVFASFEKALRHADGDIIFLSDQDDLWFPGKVEKTIDVFFLNPQVTLVASDASVIDKFGSVVEKSFFARRGRFTAGVLRNIVKNKYLGCSLAFRRSMLKHFLPIPGDVPMHDMWIGILNDIYGKTHFIDEPLIAYRRHGDNLSPSAAAPLVQRLVWRWRLVKNLILRVMRSRLHATRYRHDI